MAYKIYADNDVLYNPEAVNAYPVIDPTLSVELNKAGSASFTLLPSHPLYNSIQKLKTKITIYDANSVLWRGRALNYEEDSAKRRTFLIEGQLAYLNDGIIRPYEFSGTVRNFVVKIINEYNAQVDAWKQITVGTVNVTSPEGTTITRKSTGYATPWDELNNQLVNVLGGYLVPTYNTDGGLTLSYLETPGELGTQDIRFGSNIIDLSRFVSAEDVYTVLIPTGKSISETTSDTTTSRSGANVTIESVNGGLDYIQNNAAVNAFGKIWREKNWSYISSPSELKAVARAELAKNLAESITIDITAMDLHVLNVNTQAIKLGSLHNVIADYYGLNTQYFCSKIDYAFSHPKDNRYVLGTLRQTLTELQKDEADATETAVSDTNEKINDRIDLTEGNIGDLSDLIGAGDVPDGKTVLQFAQEQATDLIINGVEGGHVFIDQNEIYIMDTTDKATARNVWRWNSGGLGFSSNGYNGPFITAMTADGRIVADMITSGKVLAEFIALFGKMAVYKTNTIDNNNIGGYIGYFTGSTGSRSTTGIQMEVDSNRVAVSDAGAILNGGVALVSVGNKAYSEGPFEVQGGLTVSQGGNMAFSNGGDIYSSAWGGWLSDVLAGKADANHTH